MKRLIALGLAITIGFSTICAVVLHESRNRDQEQARRSAVNLVTTIGSEVARNFELYNLSLEAVVDGLNLQGVSQLTPQVRQMLLFDRAASAKDMGSIFVIDKQGTVILDSRTEAPRPESFAQSYFFKVHQGVADAGAYISTPWRQPDGEYVIAISRRVSDYNGNFIGVVAGTLRLRYFTKIFEKLDVDPRSSLILAREDGSIVTRNPFVADIIGMNVSKTPIFKRISESPEGSFEMTAGIDGVQRLYVYRRIGDLPLIVSYGQAVSAIYANWQREAIIIGILLLGLCATNVALIVFLARALRRSAKAEYDYAVMATTDALTGLCNRRRFDDSIELEWRRAQRRQLPMSLLLIDADRFKSFNDKFGHQAGDYALKALAECIDGASRRAEDLCVRFGGEEFAVLLPETSLEDAIVVANNIQARVASLRAMQNGRPDSTPTLSIGVACMVPFQGLEPRDLVKAADKALYKAKDTGRNRVVAVAPEHRTLKVVAA
ncbi:MAG: GGDEF domain-containing protein [Pseudolabrys sp.]|nr:GGDEF domain-containing protein [Pseudolabrys sp.]